MQGNVVKRKSGQVTGQVIGQVETWIERILRACTAGPLSSAELSALTGIRYRETFQCNYLDRLLADHWSERTIPDKLRSRLQKYRLTTAGRALLAVSQKGEMP